MNSKDMLKAIGDIDEKFVADAEVKSDNKKVSKKSQVIRWAGAVAAVLVICIVGVSFIGSIGLMKSSTSDADSAAYDYNYDFSDGSVNGFVFSGSGKYLQEDSIEAETSYAYKEGVSIYDKSETNDALSNQNVKLIYTANMSIQTTDYEETINSVKSLVNQFEGYFESSNEYNGGMYNNAYKSGEYTIRIPEARYSSFINTVGEAGYLVSLSENVEDIGEQYFETEGRIDTLKIKQERLQELLKKASSLSDIITLENELSDVEYQLEQYTTQLNHYDSLIGYSTVNLSIQEVSAYTDSSVKKDSFGERFARAVKRGLVNSADALIDFGVWIGYNLVGIIIVIIIVLVFWKFHIIKRLIRRITGKQ